MGQWKIKLFRGRYYAYRSMNGQSKRVALRTDNIETAQRNFQDFVNHSHTPATTVKDMILNYISEKDSDTNKYIAKPLLSHFGNYRHDQIDRQLCRDYIAYRKGKKNNTIRRELDLLRSAIRFHDKNTPARFLYPKPNPPKDRYLTKLEYNRLLNAASTPHVRLFIILALGTAARSGAILELKWRQVDFDRKMVDLGQGEKNKMRAKVPMTDLVYKALTLAYTEKQTEYVIEYMGDRIRSIKKSFKRTALKAGIDDISPHTLRHTAAVWLAESGVPMSEISQYLGHNNTRITEKVYARYSPDYLRKAAGALSEGVGGSIEPY